MKLIKKIAAIMLSVMMVLGMASVVSAGEGGAEATTGNGKITITNAIPGQTYKIYKILELESFSGKPTITPVPTGAAAGNYAYKVATGWEKFITSAKTSDGTDGKSYLIKDESGYVTWNSEVSKEDSHIKEFAKKALAYAATNSSSIKAITPTSGENTNTVTFENISWGYYLVDSSAGTLCSLDTTATDVIIKEKNAVPSVEKKVKKGSNWEKNNTASIGDRVEFQTTITVQPGAQNYVLHDKMGQGLTFEDNSVNVVKSTDKGEEFFTEYTIKKSNDQSSSITDGCTFEIVLNQSYCDTVTTSENIVVTYSAILNKDAVVGKTDDAKNQNDTWLSYGDKSTTTHSTTTTKTFELPVLKYTMKNSTETPLAGATFTLSKKNNGTELIKLVSGENNTYRVAMTDETDTVTAVTTTDSGEFTIKGLDADTYYLTETKQPAGYNKLKDPVKVVIAENGTITVGEDTTTSVDKVKVLNNTGTILPSTGGNGTSLIYFLGAVLALVSGVVLITKQRMKNS